MCGIAGFAGRNTADGLERMTAVLRHRGPDDQGTLSFRGPAGWTGLGSTRLAIQDLSGAGRMPMSTEDGRYAIAYNGELYNFPDLRRTLEGRGRRFRSSGDTEVVLEAYREWGPACLDRFNGIFALAIWDDHEKNLFLARDHFGVKPLYIVGLPGGGMAFASEAKALFELPEIEAAVDPSALVRYLTFLWVPEPGCLFRGVTKLPPAHYCLYRTGAGDGTGLPERRRYWELRFPEAGEEGAAGERRSGADGRGSAGRRAAVGGRGSAGRRAAAQEQSELVAQVRERLGAAVERQMLSDAPVGAFLSAGLDSSCIVAAMAERSEEPVRTFTVDAAPSRAGGAYAFDDPGVAERTARRLGCRHRTLRAEPAVAELLPKLAWHMDEPVGDPAVATAYMVSRAASRDVKVLLSGVGGDEVFGGYRKYRAHYLALRYRRLPGLLRRGLVEPLAARMPALAGTRLAPRVRLLKKMARSASLPPVDRFVANSIYLDEDERAGLLADGLADGLGGADPREAHLDAFARCEGADFLNRMLYVDMATFLPSLNLLYTDKTSMAASVEVRVPFLDRELVEWTAARVPPRMKVNGSAAKYVLRLAMGDAVGPEVLAQPKTGFGAPADAWLRGGLSEMMQDLLAPDRMRRRGFVRAEAVQSMIARHLSGREDLSFQLWQLLALELWAERFLG